MFEKTIQYTDYNGQSRTETFLFHLSKNKIQDLEWRTPGGIENYVKRIMETMDGQKMADLFKWLIKESYGVKSLDGRRFMQSDEIFLNFAETPAYEKFYMELATNSNAASEFFTGIFPPEAVEAARKQKEMAVKAGLELVPGINASQVQFPSQPQVAPTPAAAPVVPVAPAIPVQPAVPPVIGQETFTPVQ